MLQRVGGAGEGGGEGVQPPPPPRRNVPWRRKQQNCWAVANSVVMESDGNKDKTNDGPPLILPPALKRWGSPRRQGLCSHLAHLWATSDFARRCEAVGTP